MVFTYLHLFHSTLNINLDVLHVSRRECETSMQTLPNHPICAMCILNWQSTVVRTRVVDSDPDRRFYSRSFHSVRWGNACAFIRKHFFVASVCDGTIWHSEKRCYHFYHLLQFRTLISSVFIAVRIFRYFLKAHFTFSKIISVLWAKITFRCYC